MKSGVLWAMAALWVLLGLVGCAAPATQAGESSGLSSLRDSDADGVRDRDDDCVSTLAADPVWTNGCSQFNGPIHGLAFAPGDHRLNREARRIVAVLVESMKQRPSVVLALGGHTDNRGAASDNLELSKRRVMAVVRYMVANGIDARRLQPYGYGESRPVRKNASREGRAVNRRIEVSVVQR